VDVSGVAYVSKVHAASIFRVEMWPFLLGWAIFIVFPCLGSVIGPDGVSVSTPPSACDFWTETYAYMNTETPCSFDHEHRDTMYFRDVGNTAQVVTVQGPRSKINMNNELPRKIIKSIAILLGSVAFRVFKLLLRMKTLKFPRTVREPCYCWSRNQPVGDRRCLRRGIVLHHIAWSNSRNVLYFSALRILFLVITEWTTCFGTYLSTTICTHL
jgi:hypothetical protein